MFLAFAFITLLGALMVLCMRNLVLAGLSLVLSFIGMAGLFLLLANPVAAALQVIVYSGAIVVLLLFVIMLLNSHREEPSDSKRSFQIVASILVVSALAAGAVKLVLASSTLGTLKQSTQLMTLEVMGANIFREQILAVEVAGLLLLAAMVSAVSLVKREL